MIVPRYTREIPQRFRLEADKCTQCGYIAFPPRLICPECQSQKFDLIKLKPEGTIITFTTAQVVDCKLEDIEIGKKVKLMFRRIQKEGKSGILQYGYKAILM
jgi:uncharacterized OB-fold protein